MRIIQIQPMREYVVAASLFSRSRLYFGFVGVAVAFAFWQLWAIGTGHALVEKKSPMIISGLARVIDGDTIQVSGHRIRLEGIDAPEAGQRCPAHFVGSWRCGHAATGALRSLISRQRVECEKLGRDIYGRVLALCRKDGKDINAHMVRSGLAWAFVKYSQSYVAEEAKARAAKLGVWSGLKTAPAWIYRKKTWAKAEQTAPRGCAIKGNISSHGRIYHMPWSPWYHKVSIDRARGDKWFCSESEALAAGWRPVREF